MDLEFTPEERAFRDEVRAFIRDNLPPELAEKNRRNVHLEKDDIVTWHRILHKQGWGAPNWPKEYGGPGWSPVQRYIFDEETAAADAPGLAPFGIAMVGPVIYTFGTEEQKKRYLPRILSMEDWWCQGYSEPGAGSDLASLRTRADSDGDHYIVNGHKIWTTQAHFANMMFCLVRTDQNTKPQEGISFLLIDMNTPGITVRPIISIDEGHSVNEVFLDNVRVPKTNLIGKEGKGWTYAKFLLGNERTTIAEVARSKQRLRRLKEIARAEQAFGAPLLQDPAFRDKVAAVEIDLLALEYTNLRVLAAENAGKGVGPEVSMLKIRGSEIQQTITELACEALGYYAAPYERRPDGSNQPPVGPDYAQGRMESFLYYRATTIYGGSNEIQRNIIAKMVLGL
ncbi:MAG TPA: acyl-CoA dehydrogenase family protein [Ferrovibrio sp.]|uniref:acyl-CoA dehydrogenase family protein n=1 Tax=Ferrovibrio sp. TaxID=1917215 RepID=UPI002B4B33C0|nr:acyl-CoA dehydrogenase family protein [Ferrovibrio sp.]HLT77836.1 acyl-CoA dehydrogenase family protein [Ferrovibrio sp.]